MEDIQKLIKSLERCNVCGYGHYSDSKCSWCNGGEHRYFLVLKQKLEEKIKYKREEMVSGEDATEHAEDLKEKLLELSFIKKVHNLFTF